MKFHTIQGVGKVRGDHVLAGQCYVVALTGKKFQEALPIDSLDLRVNMTNNEAG